MRDPDEIPADMVEAAAEAYATEHGSDWHSPPVPPSLVESWRQEHREVARAILAAALSVGEVEVRRAITGDDSGGPWIEYVHTGDGWPDLCCPGDRRVESLSITTPWVEVTE